MNVVVDPPVVPTATPSRLIVYSATPTLSVEAFQRIVGRAYPRAAPGTLLSLSSDPATGALHLSGKTDDKGGALDVWVPATWTPPVVSGTNVAAIRVLAVDGGYRVTARASRSYQLSVTR